MLLIRAVQITEMMRLTAKSRHESSKSILQKEKKTLAFDDLKKMAGKRGSDEYEVD